MKEEHRDARSVRWIDTLLKDVRYGLLLLARDPGFAAVAIGVMAIGIGANTAMFSLVDAVLLKPLPYPDPDRIVRVWERRPRRRATASATLNFLDWKRLSTSFEALSATRGLNVALTGNGEPARLGGHARVRRLLRGLRRQARARAHVPAAARTSRAPARSSC